MDYLRKILGLQLRMDRLCLPSFHPASARGWFPFTLPDILLQQDPYLRLTAGEHVSVEVDIQSLGVGGEGVITGDLFGHAGRERRWTGAS